MQKDSPPPPSYQPELFVDREGEVSLVRGLARQVSEAGAGSTRTVVFQGERGVGKTWLALHLVKTILPAIDGVQAILISLFKPPESYIVDQTKEIFQDVDPAQPPEAVVRTVLQRLAEILNVTTASEADLRTLANWLARDVEQRSQGALVLVIDSVFETNWNILQPLEQYVLAPLAAIGHVLIVLTGRGRLYPWESPYLRIEAEERHLKPFEDTEIGEQLDRLNLKDHSPETIRALGGGHPLTNVLLGRAADPVAELDEIANTLLSVITNTRQRQKIRGYFEALCLLDGFREDEISFMLATYDSRYANLSLEDVREIRNQLLETHLVRWENGRFVVDESIRGVLENYLERQHKDIWQKLHRSAYDHYCKWSNEFKRWREYYRQRATRHAAALEIDAAVVCS